MAGVPVNAFTETVRLTGLTVFTGARDIINDSQKTNYNTQGYLMRGQPMSSVIQGGTQIVDDIFLSAVRKARPYRAGAKQSYSNPQTGIQLACPWRQFITDITWDDTERELNEGAAREGNRSLQLKDIWTKKQMVTYSDWCDFTEELYWNVPDKTRMEDANGDLMYSFPALINEFTSGLYPAAAPGGLWSTKLGIDPTAAGQTRWDNQRFAYTDVNVASTSGGIKSGSLISVFKTAFNKLDLRPPPQFKEYFEAANAKPASFVACSQKGQTFVWDMYMSSQNRWSDQMDPWGMPTFGGVPFVYVGQLDGAPLYPTGTAGALSTEDAFVTAAACGPRYKLIQSEYIKQFYHSKFTFRNLGVMDDRAQPTSHTMPLLTWTNLFPRSLYRQGEIYPSSVAAFATGF